MGLFLNDCYLFPVIGHQACSQEFFVVVGGGGGGGGGRGGVCERGQGGPSYQMYLFIFCLVRRLFQGALRVTPTGKTRQDL